MDIAIVIVVILFFLIGLIGTVLPAIPGTGLIFLGIATYALYFGTETVGIGVLVALGLAAALSFLFDYLGSVYGAKRYGSTVWGIAGSVAGGIIGMIVFNIIGLVLGIFLGAALAEMLGAGKDARQSISIGFGAVLGFLGGTILKLLLGIIMIAVFLVQVLF